MTQPRGLRRLAVVVVGALLPLTGCAGDPHEAYCEEVRAQRADLSEAVAGGGPTALVRALPIFEELEAVAPRDIRDEWDLVVGRVEELVEALEAAGVDPASYDREDPPGGLTAQERVRIDAAARELTAPATVEAFAGVQQQARDVCKTPLSL